MQTDLISKIATDLEKSGFGSEMKALRTLRNANWHASGFAYYIDLDTETTRESDIRAHLAQYETNNKGSLSFQCFYSLCIEVKKCEKPWVVFKESPHYDFELSEGMGDLIFCDGLPKDKRSLLSNILGETSFAKTVKWYGNGIHEAFKNPDQPSRWYSAFVSACKAAEYALKQNSWDISKGEQASHYPYVWFSKPVIVLDGRLFSSELKANGELIINEEEMCSVKFRYASEKYRRRHYFVDVVTISALEKYLSFASERNKQIALVLKECASTD